MGKLKYGNFNRPNNIVGKFWGFEKWISVTDNYIMKILHIEFGNSIILQYHKEKKKTWYVINGNGNMFYDDDEFQIKQGDMLHIPPFTKHKVTSLSEDGLEIAECSSTQLEDVVRLDRPEIGG